MNQLLVHYSTSMSLDGFVAGPHQSKDNPLGINGGLLHDWMKNLAVWRKDAGLKGGETNASTDVYLHEDRQVGALIMGRNMFGGQPGPWTEPFWNGWWGKNPPFHMPVFVLTHFSRPPLILEGNNTFTFVTEGITTALDLARKNSNGKDISIAGGGSVAKEFLKNGLLDYININLIPVFLGDGVKLFDDSVLANIKLEQVRVVEAPSVVHLRYQVVK